MCNGSRGGAENAGFFLRKREAPRCFKWVKTGHGRKIWNSRTQEKERNKTVALTLKAEPPGSGGSQTQRVSTRGANTGVRPENPAVGWSGGLPSQASLKEGMQTSQPDQEIHVLLVSCLFTLPEFMSSRLKNFTFASPASARGNRNSVVIHQNLP